MSAYKYDSYEDYLAGARFLENLANWLQQFNNNDKQIAYRFLKNRVIYFSPPEIQRLVEKFFPEFIQQQLITRVSENCGVPKYLIWASKKGLAKYRAESRKTLYMGLSDGARLDALRRTNVGQISNEQVVVSTQTDEQKWHSLVEKLKKDLKKITGKNENESKFSRVYLIDDFTASGTSFLRKGKTPGEFEGKLDKFAKSLNRVVEILGGDSPFISGFDVIVHHYIGTEMAKNNINEVYADAKNYLRKLGLKNISFSYGMILADEIRISTDFKTELSRLCRDYYDPALEGGEGEEENHGLQSGIKSRMFGYANCSLPVVLEHNTPNNSIPLLWADTPGNDGAHRMRPLFRRRERHSDMV